MAGNAAGDCAPLHIAPFRLSTPRRFIPSQCRQTPAAAPSLQRSPPLRHSSDSSAGTPSIRVRAAVPRRSRRALSAVDVRLYQLGLICVTCANRRARGEIVRLPCAHRLACEAELAEPELPDVPPAVVLCLYSQGWSLTLLFPHGYDGSEELFPYNEEAHRFMRDIDCNQIPLPLLEVLAVSGEGRFDQGSIVAEIRDYRPSYLDISSSACVVKPCIRYAHLRPTPQSLLCDIHALRHQHQQRVARPWTFRDWIAVEQQILTERQIPLQLDPSPLVFFEASSAHYNKNKFNLCFSKGRYVPPPMEFESEDDLLIGPLEDSAIGKQPFPLRLFLSRLERQQSGVDSGKVQEQALDVPSFLSALACDGTHNEGAADEFDLDGFIDEEVSTDEAHVPTCFEAKLPAIVPKIPLGTPKLELHPGARSRFIQLEALRGKQPAQIKAELRERTILEARRSQDDDTCWDVCFRSKADSAFDPALSFSFSTQRDAHAFCDEFRLVVRRCEGRKATHDVSATNRDGVNFVAKP
eukprot:m.153145 g.153145  ORF g.153145 m.153145 type:complete len:524 (+) comp10172_c0_seq2:359-1930(+)